MAYTDIDDPSSVFQCTLYSGNAGTQTITHGGNSDLQADLIWLKGRNHSESHFLTDSSRGVNSQLYANQTIAEGTATNVVTAIGSDSFNIGNYSDINTSGKNYVSWNWKKQAGVFDIVTYTGNGSNRTISHNLGAVPTMMVTKVRSTTNQWLVYHKSMGNTETMKWDDTSAATTQSNLWNSTTPTSSVFSVGTHTGSNLNGGTFVMYLFGDKQGVSKMGSYKGNGNADGPFIYTGFRPAWIMQKSTTTTYGWQIYDNKRSGFNGDNDELVANTTSAETNGSGNGFPDILSNGFKLRNTDINKNASGVTYIYMAFAENPFVTSTGVPATAR